MNKLKKFLCLLLGALFVFAFAACREPADPGTPGGGDDHGGGGDETELEDNSGMPDDSYNLKTYLYPLWEGTTVYNETLWFTVNNYAPLLYEPDQVLSVRSYDLKTTYTEGVDYVVDGNAIVLLSGSSIPFMSESQYFPSSPPTPSISLPHDGGGYWYITEGNDISLRQVVVTYTHKGTRDWTMPRIETDKFPQTMQKLENGESIKIVFYGDSITVGANSSEFLGIAPHEESYANMVKSYIEARYPQADVQFANTAVGGTDSNWGNSESAGVSAIDQINADEGDHFQLRVLDENPDLLFIAYGMNDQDYSPDTRFKNNIASMIEKVRKQNPNVEIMLVSGMIANPETAFYNKDYLAYQEALSELCEECENVGLATTLNTVLSVYDLDENGGNGKRFQDCTANNANHPNDFLMRVYAQTIVYSLFGEDYIDHI